MTIFILSAAVFITSWLGTDIFRRFGLRKSLLDVPNERSSHTAPVPRGGGVVIVFLSLLVYAAVCITYPNSISAGYVIGSLLVASISAADDLFSLPFFVRLSVHCLAAALVVFDVGSFGGLHLPAAGPEISFGSAGAVVTFFWLVWMINAYNFMDGIDGIAGIQAAVASAGWAAIAYFAGAHGLVLFCASVGASALGFLVQNWSPARIFMGDVGSAFLGFTFGSIPLMIGRETTYPSGWLFATAIFILWPFLFDTVYTLARRITRRETLWEAHRSHLYQRLVISGYSHTAVSLLYGTFAICITVLASAALIGAGIYEYLVISLAILISAGLLGAVSLTEKVDLNP